MSAEFYEAGQSLASIGRQFVVHHTTVANELRQAGVEIRPRPGWTRPEPGQARR